MIGRFMDWLIRDEIKTIEKLDIRPILQKHGTGKAALQAIMEDGSFRKMPMFSMQKLLTLAYAEDNGWKVKEGP